MENMGQSHSHRTYINNAILNEYGYSLHCPGCDAEGSAVFARNHTEQFRARVDNTLRDVATSCTKNVTDKETSSDEMHVAESHFAT